MKPELARFYPDPIDPSTRSLHSLGRDDRARTGFCCRAEVLALPSEHRFEVLGNFETNTSRRRNRDRFTGRRISTDPRRPV
jgi:hypothetical protein